MGERLDDSERMHVSLCVEEIFGSLIQSGRLHLAENGTAWWLKKKVGGRAHRLIPVATSRADRVLPNGYTQVQCYVDGVRFACLSHRLVWYVEHGEIPKGCYVHHKNGIKHDNRLENLEIMDGKKHVLMHMLERAPWNKWLTKQDPKLAEWHAKGIETKRKKKEVM